MNEFPHVKISIETEIGGIPFSTYTIIDISDITEDNLKYCLTGKTGSIFKNLINAAKQCASYKDSISNIAE